MRDSLDVRRMTRSIRLALTTFIGGFLIEAATELYQLVTYGVGWSGSGILTYAGLAATLLGFYLMYRGRHEWTEEHHRNVRRGHRSLWAAVGMFLVAVVAIGVLATEVGPGLDTNAFAPLVWIVGGLVALAFGNFFFGLLTLVAKLVRRFGQILTWVAFGWSMGVAVLTGYVIGGQFPELLSEFLRNPLLLFASFAPLAYVMAPLFVSYLLFAGAYADALMRLRAHGRKIDSEMGAVAKPA